MSFRPAAPVFLSWIDGTACAVRRGVAGRCSTSGLRPVHRLAPPVVQVAERPRGGGDGGIHRRQLRHRRGRSRSGLLQPTAVPGGARTTAGGSRPSPRSTRPTRSRPPCPAPHWRSIRRDRAPPGRTDSSATTSTCGANRYRHDLYGEDRARRGSRALPAPVRRWLRDGDQGPTGRKTLTHEETVHGRPTSH